MEDRRAGLLRKLWAETLALLPTSRRRALFNELNTTNLGFDTSSFVGRSVSTTQAGQFVDFAALTDSIGRTMRMRLKSEW